MREEIVIKVGGEELFLGDNFKINFEINSPMFGGDIIQGSTSFAFNLPRTARNHRLLGVPHNIEAFSDVENIVAIEFEYGVFYFQGKLKLRTLSQEFIRCNIQIDIGQFAETLNNTALSDLPLDEVTIEPKKPFLLFELDTSAGTPVNGDLYDLRVARASAADTYHRVLYNTDEATTIADLINNINTVRTPQAHVLANTYEDNEVVIDGTTYYECILDAPASTAITNVTYWFEIGNFAAYKAAWDSKGLINSALYDDPDDDYLITAEAGPNANGIYLNDDNLSKIGELDPNNTYNVLAGSTMDNSAVMTLLTQTTDPSNLASVYWDAFRIHMDGTTTSTYPDASHVFFPIQNSEYIDIDDLPGTTKILSFHQNYYNTIIFDRFSKFRYSSNGGTTNAIEFATPFTYAFHILDKIVDELGLQKEGEVFDHVELKKLVLYSNISAEQPFEIKLEGYYINRFDSKIKLAQYMPDMNLNDFIKAFAQMFFVGIFINPATRKFKMRFLSDVVRSSEFEDWTSFAESRFNLEKSKIDTLVYETTPDSKDEHYAENIISLDGLDLAAEVSTFANLPATEILNQVRRVTDENAYYKTILDSDFDVVWVFHSLDFLPFTSTNGTGSDKQEITIKADSIVMHKGVDASNGTRSWLIPKVSQQGTTKTFFQKGPFSLRFLFYRGLHPDSNAVDYPLGTSGIEDYDGTVIGKLALQLNGNNGLVNKLAKPWVTFQHRNKRVIKNVWLNSQRLHNALIEIDKKRKIEGNLFLIESIKIQLPITEPAQVTFRTANTVSGGNVDLTDEAEI